jgi:hypothetical protein
MALIEVTLGRGVLRRGDEAQYELVDRLVASPKCSIFDVTYHEGYQKLSSASFRGSPSNC